MPKPARILTPIIPGGCGCLLLVGLLAALASLLSLTLWIVPLAALGADDEGVEDPARPREQLTHPFSASTERLGTALAQVELDTAVKRPGIVYVFGVE